jgi:hypothetical protein
MAPERDLAWPGAIRWCLLLMFAASCNGVRPPPSVALFYGPNAPLEALKGFDVVVVDPDHGADPLASRSGPARLYAYVSVGEAHPSRPWFKDLAPAWKLASSPTWGSAILDLAHPPWPTFLVERVISPLWARGYRGFFLDTLDSYRLVPGFDEAAQRHGLVELIETLHRRFPGIQLILNRGFEIVPLVKDKIAMVAAESLFRGWDGAGRRYVEVKASDRAWLLGQLRAVRDQTGLPVLVIDYVDPADRALARTTARQITELGLVPWVTDGALGTLGVGAIDPRAR